MATKKEKEAAVQALEAMAKFEIALGETGYLPLLEANKVYHGVRRALEDEAGDFVSPSFDGGERWVAPSQSDPDKEYVITLKDGVQNGEWQCSCPAWTRNTPRKDCKHIKEKRRELGI